MRGRRLLFERIELLGVGNSGRGGVGVAAGLVLGLQLLVQRLGVARPPGPERVQRVGLDPLQSGRVGVRVAAGVAAGLVLGLQASVQVLGIDVAHRSEVGVLGGELDSRGSELLLLFVKALVLGHHGWLVGHCN